MKKTLIALTIAASAAASASAMAWVENGTGGSVDISGTITPDTITSPWEVKVGSALTGLNAQVSAGETALSLNIPADSLVLGIRSKGGWINGGAGISPQIDYHGATGSTYTRGVTDLTLAVKDADSDQEIGSLTTKLTAGALGSTITSTTSGYYAIGANQAGDGFYGGLGSAAGSALYGEPEVLAANVDSTIIENFEKAGSATGVYTVTFADTDAQYNAFYVSALESANAVNIQLNNPVTTDINWKASLPVTVTYQ
ncbi:hypothetical protein [Escherichia coli]|uniref:F4 family fimbrial subunit n=1 Tax=Escherichia coli TaxID=562 RepID=UPI00096A6208|nr:hypothetical protein [Escherichia coli]